jgi:heptosyltransferase-2/heptosyltransferase-3
MIQLVGAAAIEDVEFLLDALGLPRPAERPAFGFEPTDRGRAQADGWLAAHPLGSGPRVAIHPGAGAAIKLWSAERWAQVADGLIASGATILITAGPDELALARRIQERGQDPRPFGQQTPHSLKTGRPARVAWSVPLAEGLSWDELAALYKRMDLVVGMDSGPLHLAQAVGTATVRLYGPSDPRLYGPVAGNASAHTLAPAPGWLACVPCGDFIAPPCGYRIDPPCLAAITAEQVVSACLETLSHDAPAVNREGRR